MDKICTFFPISKLQGECRVAGDKSISHRAIIFGSISQGITEISNFLPGLDCISTIECFRKMGVTIEVFNRTNIKIYGVGLDGLGEPTDILDVGNSGTTIRLLAGLLSGANFNSILTGDKSIRTRPMNRVVKPLSIMGANIYGRNNNNWAPLAIIGSKLSAITYESPVSSAQIKSSILLAGLWAEGQTTVIEPFKSRDHTERMFVNFGGELTSGDQHVTLTGNIPRLKGQKVEIPGDISSAAFLIVAACIIPNSEILIKDVGINPTRSGIIDVLWNMGANIKLLNQRNFGEEPVADIYVKSSELKGVIVEGEIIPRLIDEIPILLIAAAIANGKTIIKDATELRVKETDRIQVMYEQLNKVGIISEPKDDGIEVNGGQEFCGGIIDTNNDHRIGLAFAIAACIANSEITILNYDAVNVSFPNFNDVLSGLGGKFD